MKYRNKKRTAVMLFIISVLMVIFGAFWTIFTFFDGDNPFLQGNSMYQGLFVLGILFVILSIVQGVYHFKSIISNSKDNNIKDESDKKEKDNNDTWKNIYCPYCGNGLENDFIFCNKCGKKLP